VGASTKLCDNVCVFFLAGFGCGIVKLPITLLNASKYTVLLSLVVQLCNPTIEEYSFEIVELQEAIITPNRPLKVPKQLLNAKL